MFQRIFYEVSKKFPRSDLLFLLSIIAYTAILQLRPNNTNSYLLLTGYYWKPVKTWKAVFQEPEKTKWAEKQQ